MMQKRKKEKKVSHVTKIDVDVNKWLKQIITHKRTIYHHATIKKKILEKDKKGGKYIQSFSCYIYCENVLVDISFFFLH